MIRNPIRYNTICFYRIGEPGKKDAVCLCEKCRESRGGIIKAVEVDRMERAREIVRRWKKLNKENQQWIS